MLQNRPIALTLIASVLLYSGCNAIFETIVSLSDGRLNMNLAFLLLPAGIGLLRLSDSWRKFTLFCLWIAALIIVGFAINEIFRPGQMPVTWAGKQLQGAGRYIFFTTLMSVAAILIFWMIRTLTRNEIRKLFQSDSAEQLPEPPPGSGATPSITKPPQ